MWVVSTGEVIEAQDASAYAGVEVDEVKVQFPTPSTSGIGAEASPFSLPTMVHYEYI